MPVLSRLLSPFYPRSPPLTELERQCVRDAIARLPPEQRAAFLSIWNIYLDRPGFIYCLLQYCFDPTSGWWFPLIKYGLSSNLELRMEAYNACFPSTWLFYWPTRCVKVTEAIIHARLRARGIGVDAFYCCCGHCHREFFWGWGIYDVCREVEEVLFDTAQPIIRYAFP
ncbi:hypothetical protein R3P38DRAFT_3190727 [Favolaschia claudopus]|uniref:Bacteriophage T5 Orf172 DNA-binding domain-containing protein n=1 Tax=Favolaschia claudopus TaxID=2862362 RepID=A0AAW0BMP0_9AGAR